MYAGPTSQDVKELAERVTHESSLQGAPTPFTQLLLMLTEYVLAMGEAQVNMSSNLSQVRDELGLHGDQITAMKVTDDALERAITNLERFTNILDQRTREMPSLIQGTREQLAELTADVASIGNREHRCPYINTYVYLRCTREKGHDGMCTHETPDNTTQVTWSP